MVPRLELQSASPPARSGAGRVVGSFAAAASRTGPPVPLVLFSVGQPAPLPQSASDRAGLSSGVDSANDPRANPHLQTVTHTHIKGVAPKSNFIISSKHVRVFHSVLWHSRDTSPETKTTPTSITQITAIF